MIKQLPNVLGPEGAEEFMGDYPKRYARRDAVEAVSDPRLVKANRQFHKLCELIGEGGKRISGLPTPAEVKAYLDDPWVEGGDVVQDKILGMILPELRLSRKEYDDYLERLNTEMLTPSLTD